MNDSKHETQREDELLTRLLRGSGRGPMASPEAKARIYANVQAHWRASLPADASAAANADAAAADAAMRARPAAGRGRPERRRRRSRLVPRLALAASLAAAAIVVYRVQLPAPGPAATFAAVANVAGAVEVRRDDVLRPVGPGGLGSVRVGDVLATTDGRVALRLANGQALRLDSGTELAILAESGVELRAGSVYFDAAGTAADSAPLVIDTRFGNVRHTGTQFETSLVPGGLRIRVREGAVVFRDDARELAASAGEQVEIAAAGAPRRTTIAADDPAWRWVEDLATVAPADEYRLGEVLSWVAREMGRELAFTSGALETRAQDVVLYEIEGLNPRQTLDVIVRTTAFSYTDTGAILRVSDRAP